VNRATFRGETRGADTRVGVGAAVSVVIGRNPDFFSRVHKDGICPR
jgi:hypothetical protein